MDIARWCVFRIYCQNPYIKPPKAKSPTDYFRFSWEEPTKEEALQSARNATVSEEETAELNRIFEEFYKKREKKSDG